MSQSHWNHLCILTALVACASPAARATPNPVYYGGPVLSNAQIVMVNWGSGVPADVQANMPLFYADIMRSDYFGILQEYSTNIPAQDGLPGTNQQIRFGSFLQSVTINPTNCGSAGVTCTLTEAQMRTELANQITAGHLPAPTLDAGGHPNTVYMVHFDPKTTVTLNGSGSCQIYCAASSKFSYGNLSLSAAIIPDQTSASACYGSCGGTTSLEAETLNSMEELVNSVTDADPDFSNPTAGRPLAWFDPANGLVGDLCPGTAVQINANGHAYAVRKIWSKISHQCNYVGYLFRNSFD